MKINSCLRAELTKSDIATAEGITVKAESPVLGLCRKLIAAGYDPATPLNVYRGKTLALRIRSIGEAAGLRVASDLSGRPIFKRDRAMAGAPSMRSAAEAI